MIDMIIPLATFAFVTAISPGPNNMMLLTSAANFGLVRTIPLIAGIAIGFGVMVIGVGAGLARALESNPLLYRAMQAISALFLCWLAWNLLRVKHIPVDSGAKKTARPISFAEAAAFQWVNPKAWGMAVSSISIYLPPDADGTELVLAGLIFGVVSCITCSTWAICGMVLQSFLSDPRRIRIFNVGSVIFLLIVSIPLLLHS